MFFFGRKSNYSRAAIKEQGIDIPKTKSALFAERLWFGFMLLFALPFLIPFLLVALLAKIYKFIFRLDKKADIAHSASKFTDIYDDSKMPEDGVDYVETDNEVSIPEEHSVSDHISDIVREIEDELPSDKTE